MTERTSRGSAGAADLGPGLKRPRPHGSELPGRDMIVAEVEEVVNPIVRREKPLRLSRRFESLWSW